MTSIESIKNRRIDRIMITNNEKLLVALESKLDSTETGNQVILNKYQIKMLRLSEKDIEEGNLISDDDLKKTDSEWMD